MAEKETVTTSDKEDSVLQGGFFNLTTMARKKVEAKRKRKGLGEVRPRNVSVYSTFSAYAIAMISAKTAVAPLERVKILM